MLRRVDSGRGFAVDVLHEKVVCALEERDRRLATELVMGVLRWRGELDFHIECLAGRPVMRLDPEIVTILRLGVYQIRHLERIPKSAVVNESVELAKVVRKRSAAALVNAALRKCEPPLRVSKAHSGPGPEEYEAACRAMPGWLFERWAEYFGIEAARHLAWASVQTPRTMLRVCQPADVEEVRRKLAAQGLRTRTAPYTSRAVAVETGDVQATEAWRQGALAIQDEASQLVVELLSVQPRDSVLDLCAAPGMKAAQIAERIASGILVSCDRSGTRLRTLAQRLRAKAPTGVAPLIVQLDATQALPFRTLFQRILVDAPCSGTGTLARNPEIKWRLRASDIVRLAENQRAMLAQALGFLAGRGRLVYSTCSLEPEENEGVVDRVLGETDGIHLLDRGELTHEFPKLAPLFDARGYFRTRPDRDHMDGFFAAVIEKRR